MNNELSRKKNKMLITLPFHKKKRNTEYNNVLFIQVNCQILNRNECITVFTKDVSMFCVR